jgi:hypothetical protein
VGDAEVSSHAIDDGARLLLFDPLAVPSEILELAADREPVVVLTAPWHERETRSLVERLRAPVFVPPPDTQDDLVQKYGDGVGGKELWCLMRQRQPENRDQTINHRGQQQLHR